MSDATANGVIVQYHDGEEFQDAYHNPWPDVANARRYVREMGFAGQTVRIIERVTTETVLATIAGSES